MDAIANAAPEYRLKKILLWISIIYYGQWLNSLFYNLSEDTHFRYIFMNFANPFILFFLFVCIYVVSDRQDQKAMSSSMALKFLFVPLTFMLLEAIHFPDSYTIFTKIKYTFYAKLISNSLSMCLLLGIFELSFAELKSQRFFHLLIKIITVKAIIFMLISMLAVNNILSIETNEIIYNNGQAYESLTIVFLLFFNKRISLNLKYKHGFLLINALPIFAFQCRGAALIFCFIYVIFFFRVIYRNLFGRHIKTLALSCCIFILAIAYLAGGYNAFNYMYGFIPARDIYGKTQISHVVKLLSLIKNLLLNDNSIKEIMLLHNYGAQLTDATISAYARIGSIMMAFKHFINYPLIGQGAYDAYALNIEGYGIHSLLPLILASYGLVGFLPFMLFGLYLIKKSIALSHNHFYVINSSFYILLVMTFTNGFIWWYSLIVILMRIPMHEPNQIKQPS